jgi:ribosomal protein S6
MKRYEGLVILNLTGKEEGVDEVVGRLTAEVEASGGKLLQAQKLDKKSFARQSVKNLSGGHYVNLVIEVLPGSLTELQAKILAQDEVLRVLFTHSSGEPAPVETPVETVTV